MVFSVNIIRQLHTTLYRYLSQDGGYWKLTDNKIVERNPDGSILRVRFVPISAVETPDFMNGLVQYYNEAIDDYHKEPLIIIPLTILDFLCVHPFSDGNGRIARLLTLKLLYHFEFQVGRYISIERIIEESKETYYETL